MYRTYEEINEKIAKGEAVILRADEIKKMAETCSEDEILKKVDVVTTATFAPMCSSGAFINFGNTVPSIRMEKILLNNVPIYGGIAAADAYIGATEESLSNPQYGGAHILEALVNNEELLLEVSAKGTDCYPKKKLRTYINKNSVNEIIMVNPRNLYQNYPVAVNSSKKEIYTYMGKLLPNFGNASYSTSGELSPLLNDPDLETIGIGTKIYFAGADGIVISQGTQFSNVKERNKFGVPLGHSATLAISGNLKEMKADYIKAAYFKNYGVTLFVGIGLAIPVLNKNLLHKLLIKNKNIETYICDYSKPEHPIIGKTNYEELQNGKIELKGKYVPTGSLSSVSKAKKIADELKTNISNGKFLLSQPIKYFHERKEVKSINEEKRKNRFSLKGDYFKFSEKGISKNLSKCVHCGFCISLCQFSAIQKDSATEKVIFNEKKCVACRKCLDACPVNAISFMR